MAEVNVEEDAVVMVEAEHADSLLALLVVAREQVVASVTTATVVVRNAASQQIHRHQLDRHSNINRTSSKRKSKKSVNLSGRTITAVGVAVGVVVAVVEAVLRLQTMTTRNRVTLCPKSLGAQAFLYYYIPRTPLPRLSF